MSNSVLSSGVALNLSLIIYLVLMYVIWKRDSEKDTGYIFFYLLFGLVIIAFFYGFLTGNL